MRKLCATVHRRKHSTVYARNYRNNTRTELTDVSVSEMYQIIKEAVAMVATLLRPVDARTVNHVTIEDWRRNVSWYTDTQSLLAIIDNL